MTSTSKGLESNTQDITSIHAGLIEEVHDIPMGVLIRPFPLEVNDEKVYSIMKTLQVSFYFMSLVTLSLLQILPKLVCIYVSFLLTWQIWLK
jgi:hypothetical protein